MLGLPFASVAIATALIILIIWGIRVTDTRKMADLLTIAVIRIYALILIGIR